MPYRCQEALTGLGFFASLGGLSVSSVQRVPEQAPTLVPRIPLFVTTAWTVGIEEARHRSSESTPAARGQR